MSNARNLARLLPNSSGQLPPANVLGGKVLQVVQGGTGSYIGINTTTPTLVTGVTCSITPISTSSKILVLINISEFRSPQNVGGNFYIYRNGSSIVNNAKEVGYNGTGSYTPTIGLTHSFSYLDSPATTSPVTYDLYARKLTVNSGDLQFLPNGGGSMLIQLMEIAA